MESFKSKKRLLINIAIFVCLVVGLSFFCIKGVAAQVMQHAAFCEGIHINDVDVSNQTFEQVSEHLLSTEQQMLDEISLTIRYNGFEQTYRASDLGLTTNASTILEEAYHYEKTALSDRQAFDRYASARRDGVYFQTQLQCDTQVLRSLLESIAEQADRPATDASVQFDTASRTFSYTSQTQGIHLDIDAAMQQIEEKLKQHDYSALVLEGETILPNVTVEELYENTVLIGRCKTDVTSNTNRNTNIQLMCNAVNGLAILPGQTLSINGLVGQRTEEKGFLPAPAIMDGKRLEDDIGGGICQLSGTLYNAALYADMEIVERVKHSFPSDYLPIGLDSTLNWDNKDLKIKNASDYPIYIAAFLDNGELTVELYGQPLEEGISIEVVNDILEVIEPEPTKVHYTDSLASGKKEVVVKSRKGYKVKVYRNYYRGENLINSQLISSDTYRAIQGVTMIGTGSTTAPTVPPEASPDPNVPTPTPPRFNSSETGS